MDRRVQRLACRVAVALAAAATLSLLYLFRHASTSSCFPAPHSLTLSLASFPRTSCDAASRRVVPPDRRLDKLRASLRWRRRSAALAAAAFPPLRCLRLLAGSSRVLCLAAGAGNAVDALHAAGVSEVTGIDLVDFPPLVRRADPHSLPFSDGSFDLVFSDEPAGISGALFPSRLAAEAERAVRRGGAIALAVDRHLDPAAVAALFERSRVVDTRDVTLDGSRGSLPSKLLRGHQDDLQAPVQGVCAHIPLALSDDCEAQGKGTSQQLLQALHAVYMGTVDKLHSWDWCFNRLLTLL